MHGLLHLTVILEVNKHLLKYCILLEIDFQTHVFGSALYRVSRGIHVTQMMPHNWLITLCIINEFEQ